MLGRSEVVQRLMREFRESLVFAVELVWMVLGNCEQAAL
jgi:hypothetical protein